MREFLIYSRKGPTASFNYREGLERRMDLVARAAISAIFLSHRLRNSVFHVSLNGPPRPPLLLSINSSIRNISPNEKSMIEWMSKAIAKPGERTNPGISVERKSFQEFLREKSPEKEIFILHEKGRDISEVEIPEESLFVIGDHIGLPEKEERFATRFGKKISIGPKPYLASSVISFLNIWLDRVHEKPSTGEQPRF